MTPQTVAALTEALEDEYKARALYRQVIEAFGPVRPFVNIVESESRHAAALLALFERFGLTPPVDDWAYRGAAPASVAEACGMAVEAGIENAEMYERLLAQVDEPDVRDVLRRLQTASRENHLPAFRRCLERERKGGGGPGASDGQGRVRRRHRGGQD